MREVAPSTRTRLTKTNPCAYFILHSPFSILHCSNRGRSVGTLKRTPRQKEMGGARRNTLLRSEICSARTPRVGGFHGKPNLATAQLCAASKRRVKAEIRARRVRRGRRTGREGSAADWNSGCAGEAALPGGFRVDRNGRDPYGFSRPVQRRRIERSHGSTPRRDP